MQAALRQWTREWFTVHSEVLLRPHTAYPILVYCCTIPFRGKRTNTFTYDIQLPEIVAAAFSSATRTLRKDLDRLDTTDLPWEVRELYFPYRQGKDTGLVGLHLVWTLQP